MITKMIVNEKLKLEPEEDSGTGSEPQEPERIEKLEKRTQQAEWQAPWVWTNIGLFVLLHSLGAMALRTIYLERPWATLAFSFLCIYLSGLGVTAGAHRLWSHRSYKASWPVQWLLVCLQTMAGQNSVYTWCRDHRLHHKFAETNADPHNIKRGFFFAHMGWLCVRKHPDVKTKGKLIDMSDLEANEAVMFQHRHFWWMSIVFNVALPAAVPYFLWQERLSTSLLLPFIFRYIFTLHGTWLVNSAAHYFGHRPYDASIEARESPVVILTALGEGFHNYHHTFPFDYATSEFGRFLNATTAFIDLCAHLGLVSDRRKVDPESIRLRRLRTGELSGQSLVDGQDKKRHLVAGRLISRRLRQASRIMGSEGAKELGEIDDQEQEGELPLISGLTSMKYTM